LVECGHDLHVILVSHNKPAFTLDPRVVLHDCTGTEASSAASGFEAEPGDATQDEQSPKSKPKPERRTKQQDEPMGPIAAYVRPIRVAVANVVWGTLGSILFAVGLIRRVGRLRRKLKATKPDAVLSFLTQTNILTVLATRGLNTRTVISERNDPRLQRHRPRVEWLRRLVYRHADLVTANSRGALTALEPFVPKRKLAFLPNPLMPPTSTEIASLQAPTIITVGRLVEQKGIDVLLAAWARAAAQLPEWRLAIVGDGPLRDSLQAQSRELGIEESVDWHGHLADPFPLLRASKFFVMTSRFEGTPNALLEAMACGLPGIVSDASPGPCELVGLDQTAGLIVPVEGAGETAEAIVRLAREEPLRRRLAAAARERAREHEADQALKVWLQLLRCE